MENDPSIDIQGLACPVPLPHTRQIVMGHGSGGRMTHDLIQKVFLPHFSNPSLLAGNDAALVDFHTATGINQNEAGEPQPLPRVAISTDSHVVSPLFFPGGDIGRLAVCGTVNDVSMLGAIPLYLTAGFILEEGLPMETLEQVVDSMRVAAEEAGVNLIAGDTKVVQRGKADGMYINTAGIGLIPAGVMIGGAKALPGDIVILSGPVGDHGIAVLSARGELGFQADIHSDVAPLNHLVAAMLATSRPNASLIHTLRDPTRGGLATTLNEIARQSQLNILIEEDKIPVRPAVRAACEMLGFDPLYVANEGKLVAIVSPQDAEPILQAMRRTHYGEEAVIIGEVREAPAGRVLMKTAIGGTRIVDILAGEMLPRIC